jgi:glycosyltransferase involved in cell wall biosynthesis
MREQDHSVSVVIPTYNGSAFIREALGSVFAQTLPPREVIVVDDASPDGTADLVASIVRGAPVPLRLIRLARNSGGPAHPLNVGIEAAQHELIAVLDQDDLFEPTKLEEQGRVLAQDPGLSFVFSLCGRSAAPGEIVQRPGVVKQLDQAARPAGPGHGRIPGKVALGLLLKLWNFVIGYPGLLFRRRDWARKGGLDESLTIASDYDFVCWLSTQGEVGYVPRIQYLRRGHDANLSESPKTYVEVARVRARYLAQERWLLQDGQSSSELRELFDGLAYRARDAGRYLDAARTHYLASRVWGWDAKGLLAVAKLPPHWLRNRLFGLIGIARPRADEYLVSPKDQMAPRGQ